MSVTEPALQTLPRTALVRNAFIPREGNKLVLIDYDSQELRVVAHIGQDESMLKAFREGHDLHGETASALYGQAWTPKNRTTAKNGMYSWTYGAGISKFAKTVGVSEGEAQAVFDTLKRLYPGIARAMAQVTRTVREREDEQGFGYVKALHDGRHLRVEANKAYMGLNTLVQSTCAVVLKQALVDLDLAGLGEYLILPVHDEVLLDVPEDLVDEVVPVAIDTLRRDDFSAPLTVEAKVVSRWGEPYD
jgi:DNA polymerase-1